jgi:serine/threonine protein phosphatase PrpC
MSSERSTHVSSPADSAAQSSDVTDELPVLSSAVQRPDTISSLVELDLAGLSHPGRVRPNNEDQFFAARFDRTMKALATNLRPGDYPASSSETTYGMMVADGMGGHVAGEVASRTTVTVLLDLVIRTPDWIMRLDEAAEQEAMRRVRDHLQQIQTILIERAREEPYLAGMGTTLTLAWSVGNELMLAQVGDSRAYLMRRGQLCQLTKDQTVVQELIDAGTLTPQQAARHKLRHMLTGALSTEHKEVPVEFYWFGLADGDQLLLCSDGLTEMVPHARIAEVLRQEGSADAACRALVELALEAGGKDNVTVVVGRYRIPA